MAEPGVNFAEIILDEICLEGLDGITIQALWVRLSERFQFEVPDHLKKRFWNIAVNLKDVNVFSMPEPRENLVPFQRFMNIKGKYVLKPPIIKDDPQLAIYPYEPVKKDHGSCKFYDTRVDITSVCRSTSYEEALEKWGNHLVIVGVLEARWKALAPCSPPVFDNITRTQFSYLERIGRTRYNGETSVAVQVGQDAKSLFPHRKILLRLNLIKKRPFTQRDDKNIVTSCRLLHLPRFYRPYMSNIETTIEMIKSALKKWPNNTAPYQVIKQMITAHDSQMIAKNVLKLNEFTKIGRCLSVNYRELFPNCKDEEAISSYNGAERQVRVIQLLEQEDNQEDQDLDEWEVTGSSYVGESLMRQVYLCMRKAGPAGVTQREVAESLGLDCLTARLALKYLDKKCAVHKSMIDIKRQRMSKYTCPEFVGLRVNEKPQLSINSETLQASANNKTINQISNLLLGNIKPEKDENNALEAEASTSEVVDKALPLNLSLQVRDKMTPTKLRRTQFILDQLRQRHIISDTSNILKMCNQQEKQSGLKNGLIDKKTILRILARLESQGLLRLINVKLGKFAAPKLTFICEPHIEPSHSYIQSVVEQAKMVYLSRSSKKIPQEIKSKQLSVKIAEVKKIYGFVPKFSKMRSLHEFLFYIVYGHENIKGNIEQMVSKSLINDLSDNELSPAYRNAPEKYMFVPPVAEHSNWPRGWMLLADVLLCMPLHIFMKIVRVTVFTPTLVDYVKHPLKCQILIKNLPLEIQNVLFFKRRHVFSICEVVERLCLFGLARFGQRIMKDKDKIFIFINRTTSLLDTTSSSPSYVTIEEKNYNREFFAFQNGMDISNYWNRLQIVCLNTQLGFSKHIVGTQVEIQSAEAKMANELRSFTIEEVMELDNATVPGDARGAAGLDSSLFSHIRRSWLTLLPMKPIKRKLAEKIASQAEKMPPVPRKKPKIARNVVHQRPNPALVATKKKGKHFVRTIAKRKSSRVRKAFYDDVDKVALKNLTTLRSCWQPKEDRILHLCKTATGIIFANPRMAPSAIIRDMLHMATRVVDKTSAACRRRLLYMTKNSQISHQIKLCLAEVRQNEFIIKKYSHIYNRKRVVESSPKFLDFVREYKIHFIELVQYLHKHMYGKTDTRLSSVRLPNTLDDLNLRYNIDVPEHSTSPDTITEPRTALEINQYALTSVIHSALSCKGGKKTQAYQLLQIYRQFPESLLRETILKIRSSGMFAMTKKYNENERVSSYSTSFHLSQSYLYQLCTNTPYTMFSEIFQHCIFMMQNESRKFSPEVLDSGITALLTELTSNGLAELELIYPENLLIIDLKNVDQTESEKKTPSQPKSCSAFMDEDKLHPSRLSFSSLQLPDTPAPMTQDSLVVSSCELSVTLKSDLSEFNLSEDKIKELTTNLIRDSIYKTDPSNVDCISKLKDCDVKLAKQVFNFIYKAGPVGAQGEDIKNNFSSVDLFTLDKVLVSLKEINFIFRVGIVNSKWVSREHFQDWYIKLDFEAPKIHHTAREENDQILLNSETETETDIGKRKRTDSSDSPQPKKSKKESKKSTAKSKKIIGKHLDKDEDSDSGDSKEENDDKIKSTNKESNNKIKSVSTTYFCPSPWISPDGVLNLRVLWRWAGAILSYMISHPTINLSLLQQRFSYMTPLHIRILVEITTQIGCTEMYLIPRKKTSLWDNERCTNIIKAKVSILHSNEEIFVEISENAIVKLALYKGFSMKLQKAAKI